MKTKDKMQHFNVEADAITGSLAATACLTLVKKCFCLSWLRHSKNTNPNCQVAFGWNLWICSRQTRPVFGTHLVKLLQLNVFSGLVTLCWKALRMMSLEKVKVKQLSNGSFLASTKLSWWWLASWEGDDDDDDDDDDDASLILVT